MTSIRGNLARLVMRNRHLLRGRRRETFGPDTRVDTLRRQLEETAGLARLPKGVSFLPAESAPVYSEWVIPENCAPDCAVFYIHGGGFATGSAISHRGIVGNFMKRLGCRALTFDYRLAPEHPAPAAVEDAVAVYRWLLDQGYRPQRIAFAGDSAAGGIALAALLKLRDDGLPLPSACAAFSPCTDATLSGESHTTRAKIDPCTPPGASEAYMNWYVGNGGAAHPYASPLLGDLTGLPPLLFQVGEDEVLRDDSTRFAQKALAAGVPVRLRVEKGMFHCFPLLAPLFPEATRALDEACAFLQEHLCR